MSETNMTILGNKLQDVELYLGIQNDPEVVYTHALREAIVLMDPSLEVESMKSLGDLHLQRGKLCKDPAELDKAAGLYAAALLRCKDPDMGQTLQDELEHSNLCVQLLQGHTPRYQWSSTDYRGTADSNVLRVAEVCDKLDRSVEKSRQSIGQIYTETLVTAIASSDLFLELGVLKSLGDLYLANGKTTSNVSQFSKATAMYNKALTRCGDPATKQTLEHRILYLVRVVLDKIRGALKRVSTCG
ncbi:Hypp6397 [Branchiostoma lanceolatum]|uniref:Hypp6397 protein n=1 Tax=Branchiostoma lanceolatum TaxID=7740 RepID=A0A8J9YU49_BRALA|nr:Hypp6397 [Branchiostoma lanceolatum]